MVDLVSSAACSPKTPIVSQWAPVLAAVLVLTGAMITLTATLRNDNARHRTEREDEYKATQREAIVQISAAAHQFQLKCRTQFGSTRTHSDDADAAASEMVSKFTAARILVHDKGLQNALDAAYKSWYTIAGAPEPASGDAWDDFDRAMDALNDVALDRLKPSAVAD